MVTRSAEAPEVYVEAYGEAAAGPDVVAEAPAFAAALEVEAPHQKHHARAPPPVSPDISTMAIASTTISTGSVFSHSSITSHPRTP